MFTVKKYPAVAVMAVILCITACTVFAGTAGASSNAKGYIPEPIDMSHLKSNPPRLKVNSFGNVGTTPLPAKYDLRDYGRVPPVRNQNPYGTCWVHAALGAMESSYLTQGLTGLGTSRDINLSELHLAWFVYKDPDVSKTFTIGTANFGNGVLGQGGNANRALAFMTRLAGPVSEDMMPYSEAGTVSNEGDTKVAAFVEDNGPSAYFPLQLRVIEMYDLGDVDSSNRALVKQMIQEHGAVMVNYYAGEGATSPSGSTTAYFDNSQTTYTDHAVLLVGWDDDFSRENFSTDDTKRPTSNGAWLVRNSWGESWGDKGYFYMSYEQYIAGGSVFIAGNIDSDMKCYGYDDLGRIGTIGYAGEAVTYAANIFQAEGNENIESVGFYTTDNNVSYDVYIFDLGTSKPSKPVSGDIPSPSESGNKPFAGYHTVKLASPVKIAAGHYFSVVIKTETSRTQDSAGNNIRPVAKVSKVENLTDNANIVQNVSYITTNMTSWSPLSDSNVCIKAFTVPASTSDSGITVDAATFPDANFRSHITTKHGSSLSAETIASITTLDLHGLNIADMTGIQHFTSLTSLNISGNNLDKIDITALTHLTPENITTDPGVNILDGKDASKLSFGGHSLILSGQIGLDFYATLDDGVDSSDVDVFFTVNGKTADSMKLSDCEHKGKEYLLTCHVKSIQMAEEITATASFGDSNTVTQKYSVSDYITKLLNELGERSPDLRVLANSISDYGHYVQKPLAEANGWEYGVKYKTMNYASSDILNDAGTVKSALESFAIIKTGTLTAYSLELDLELDSDTALNFYIMPATAGAITGVTCASGDVSKQSDGSYVVNVPGISAHRLADVCTVNVAGADSTNLTVKASALTYANIVMNMESAEGYNLEELKKAVVALYKYYKAIIPYRESAGY